MKFALIGNGFIAPKHIEAIKHIGGELVAVCDIDENKRLPDIPFFTNYEEAILCADAVAICTPNDLHAEMAIGASRKGKRVLCEKPITFKQEEIELMRNVPNLFGVFQIRKLPEINEMRKLASKARKISLRVEMKRSNSYQSSWKGDPKRTGGLLVNIGIHYFDLLGHLFGYEGFKSEKMDNPKDTFSFGTLHYPNKTVEWCLDLTEEKPNYERSLIIDGVKFDLVQKENLHKKVYEDFMWGHGTTVKDEEKILRMIHAL